MKKALILLLFTTLSLTVSSQTTIKGTVIDSISHEPEPFATVRLFKEKTSKTPQSVSVTDVKGNIKHIVKGRGSYILRVSAIGRKEIERTVEIDDKTVIDLDTLLLSNDEHTLADVSVVAHKPIVKMEVDKMTYDVQADADSKSNTVLDMLRKVPMVTVDGQDNITVNGSSSFKVYVNGKPNVMMSSNPSQILKMMPASAVKNIEVITHPGAKYDAEGVGGVLNLVMDKANGAAKGAIDNSMVTLRANVGTRNYGGGVYAAMQKGKLSMSVNFNNGNQKSDNRITDTERKQFTDKGTSTQTTHSDADARMHFNYGNINMGYEIDSLRLISANFGLMGFSYKAPSDMLTSMTSAGSSDALSYTTATDMKMTQYSINGGIDYQRTFAGNADRMFTLSYQISTSPSKNKTLSDMTAPAELTWLNLTDRYSDSRTNTVEQTAQADYTSPLSKALKMDTGLKFIHRNNKSNSKYYTVNGDDYDPQTDSWMDYRHLNDILAGYMQMSLKVKKLSTKLGIRYEHTWQNVKYIEGIGDNFHLDYGNLVPSADISYAISDNMNAGATYSMRIVRPGISMLNPYVDKTDPTSLSYGNTDLDAEKNHQISGVFNYFTSKFMVNVNASYSLCSNGFSSYSFYDDNNLLNTTYGNVAKNNTTSLSTYMNWSMTKTTRLMLNASGSYVDMRSDALGYHNYGFMANLYFGVQQQLPADMRFNLNTFISTKNYDLQGSSSGFSGVMGSISKDFLKKKLNISVSGFTSFSGNNVTFKVNSSGKDYTNNIKMKMPLASLRLSVSYTIGGNVNVKKARKTIQNDDVRQAENQQQQMGSGMGQQ